MTRLSSLTVQPNFALLLPVSTHPLLFRLPQSRVRRLIVAVAHVNNVLATCRALFPLLILRTSPIRELRLFFNLSRRGALSDACALSRTCTMWFSSRNFCLPSSVAFQAPLSHKFRRPDFAIGLVWSTVFMQSV